MWKEKFYQVISMEHDAVDFSVLGGIEKKIVIRNF